MNIDIAICDDERVEITFLTGLVHRWAAIRGVEVRLSGYASAESFLFVYEDDKAVDILLLDIQMKNMDGVELARQLREQNETLQIIFITGYPGFISEGYNLSALHYLLKPVKEDKLLEVLDKALERSKKTEQVFLIQTSDATEKIPFDNIFYVEAFAHYVAIHTKTSIIETRANIGEIEKSIGNTFVRCHCSYIVGLRHISRITKTDVILDNGKAIPLSRRLYTEINLSFIEYHKRGNKSMGVLSWLLAPVIDKRIAAFQRDLMGKHVVEVENIYRQMRGWRHDYHNLYRRSRRFYSLNNIAEFEIYSKFNEIVSDKRRFIFHTACHPAAFATASPYYMKVN